MGDKTITVGQLRQNPTEMIRAVRTGERWVLTDRGVPVADIVPHRPRPWRPVEEVAAVLVELGSDRELWADIAALRSAETMSDPWDGR